METVTAKDEFIALGGSDGLIEVWSQSNLSLAPLPFQQAEMYMVHESPVQSLDFSKEMSQDKLMLASGDKQGVIKVWKVMNGKCLRTVELGLADGKGAVTVLKFT